MVASKAPAQDFEWVTTDEPHATRRKEMLAKPYSDKLRKLMGSDWTTTYWVFGLVTVQLTVAFIMRDADWLPLFIAAYCIGGTCNHSLALAMHELSHNLGFGFLHMTSNRCLAWLANLPIGFPAASSFKKYHLEHHKYQGNSEIDADLPTLLEAKLFQTTVGKIIWMMGQPIFYGVRPLLAYPKPVTRHEIVNNVIQISFNASVVYFLGWKSLVYFVAGTLSGYGLHPISGHFIAEHYTFVKGIETYSYYGPLNFLTYNVGYHNEHHDFPNVPGRLLPQVTKIAPEYYSNLPSYRSWSKVLFDFATDPHVGLYSRVKRLPKNQQLDESCQSVSDSFSSSSVSSDGSPIILRSSKLESELDSDLLDPDMDVRQRRE